MRKQVGLYYSLPQIVWLLVFFTAPLGIIIAYSFLKKGLYGGVEPQFSLEAYAAMANPNILIVTWRTLKISVIATILTLLIALPCGYSIARSRNQAMRLFLVIVPFWTNFLVRIYAWIAILGNEGFLNDILRALHLRSESIQFLYNQTSVILVLVYMYLPYAILPLFSTIDKFDFTLLDAARDLGASRFQSYVRILLPNIKSGLVTAGLFTFVPIFGAYAVPLLIGGKDSYMLGNIIADQLTKTRNWPLASAISMTVTILTTGLVFLIAMRKPREQKQVFDADPGLAIPVPSGRR